MPSHSRMRAFDRDLIRGGHYGQRPCEPHLKAEHMAAPTNAANVKKVLVNSEPSTHGTNRTCQVHTIMSVLIGGTEIILNVLGIPPDGLEARTSNPARQRDDGRSNSERFQISLTELTSPCLAG